LFSFPACHFFGISSERYLLQCFRQLFGAVMGDMWWLRQQGLEGLRSQTSEGSGGALIGALYRRPKRPVAARKPRQINVSAACLVPGCNASATLHPRRCSRPASQAVSLDFGEDLQTANGS
jgi:hypothetical protein